MHLRLLHASKSNKLPSFAKLSVWIKVIPPPAKLPKVREMGQIHVSLPKLCDSALIMSPVTFSSNAQP